MNVLASSERCLALEQRLSNIASHARATIYVALHEQAKGEEVWDPNSRTEAALEFLEVMLDELLIAALGSDAELDDTTGDPYEDMPDVVKDPEIVALLEERAQLGERDGQ